MVASYPTAYPTMPVAGAFLDTAGAEHDDMHNQVREELLALMQEVGLNPSDIYSTVASRFTAIGSIITDLETDLLAAIAALGVSQTWPTPISSGLSVGNGTQSANYSRVGDLVLCSYRLVLGSTSTITGPLAFSLPVNALMVDGVGVEGQLVDDGTATYAAMAASSSPTVVNVGVADASVTYLRHVAVSSTVPFTWTNPDEINLRLSYLAA